MEKIYETINGTAQAAKWMTLNKKAMKDYDKISW